MQGESSSLDGAAVAKKGTPGGRTSSEVCPEAAATAVIERRERRIRSLGFRDYGAFLKSSQWEEKRGEYWRHPDTLKVCEACGTDKPPLALHHRTYERVGDELLEDLTPLCSECHVMLHVLVRRGDLNGLDADMTTFADPVRALRYRRENEKCTEDARVQRDEIHDKRRVAGAAARTKREIRRTEARIKRRLEREMPPPPYAIEHLERARRRLQKFEEILGPMTYIP